MLSRINLAIIMSMVSTESDDFDKSKIIILNGVSSVGKTSVAKAIQNHAEKAFVHIQMDDFLEMLPRRALGNRDGLVFERIDSQTIDVQFGDLVQRALAGMRSAVASMAECGNNIVVDDVFFADEDSEYRRLLEPYDYRLVALFAPLEVIQTRERMRGDRDIGLAKGQFEIVHKDRVYDLEFDTSKKFPDQIAKEICKTYSL
ncbi:MAG: hypothetical protein Pars2KO_17220 [Parasphingorhabdus sp.]